MAQPCDAGGGQQQPLQLLHSRQCEGAAPSEKNQASKSKLARICFIAIGHRFCIVKILVILSEKDNSDAAG